MELMDYLKTATKSLFRFESLQEYDVEEEREAIVLFKETGQIDFSGMQDWWNFMESKIVEGVQMQRVRLVIEPLTDYTRMELELHKKSLLHGDDIRTISEEKFKTLNVVPRFDFWLVDDTTVLIVNYDDKGRYLNFSVEGGVVEYRRYVEIKNALLENSEKLV